MRRIFVTLFLFLSACSFPDVGASPTEPTIQTDEPAPPVSTEPAPAIPAEQTADVIFHGGIVLTMDADLSVVQALAVKDDQIVAVGSDQEVMAWKGEQTVLIALEGRTLMQEQKSKASTTGNSSS